MGRDSSRNLNKFYDMSFNSRARMGRDLAAVTAIGGFKKFQLTRPHGARPYSVDFR